jgi:Holliday junction resolvase RusA-like endonuclease
MPPSANTRLMRARNHRGLILTPEWRAYKDTIDLYKLQHAMRFDRLSVVLKSQLAKGFVLSVECFFVFHVEQLITLPKNGTVGKVQSNDADNRLKGCLDGLAKVLDLDDKYFFAVHSEKILTRDRAEECAMVRIRPTQIKTVDLIRKMITEDS